MDFDLGRRNFPFNIGAWDNPANNVLRNVVDSIALAPGISFPAMPNIPPVNHRMNNQNPRPWNSRDANRRFRARSNLSEMRRTIRRLRNKMRGANLNLVHVRGDLQAVREELEDIKTHLLISTSGLQNVVDEVDRITNTFNSQILATHSNDFERNELRRDLQHLRREVEDARRNIRYAENDLDETESEALEPRLQDRGQNRNFSETSNNPSTETPSTQETNNNNPNGDLCTICMGKPANTVLYKCGHICTCYQCAFKLYYKRNSRRQCPMCRAVIRDFIKIYKS